MDWIPAELPALADRDEQVRLAALARTRLRGLADVQPVVRELLLAGIDPVALRTELASAANQVEAGFGASFRRALRWIFSGEPLTVAEGRDPRTLRNYQLATADLDRWDAAAAACRR
jgi:hypothetical protein